jgi:hypothetical protein
LALVRTNVQDRRATLADGVRLYRTSQTQEKEPTTCRCGRA